MLEDSVKTIRNGEIVQGTVIDVKEDEIILNIGYKADGIITKNEYSNDASLVLTDAVHVGDTMEAKVLKVNDGEGQVTLTYKRLAAEKGNKRLEEAFENQEVLKAPVTQVLDGGLCVNVDEARVFIPASLVSDTYEKDLSKYADQEIEFVITEFNPRRRRIIGNRKQLLLAEKAEKQKELMERIHVGDTVEGTVKNVTDFGAFIDLGGADGLLHISEISWGKLRHPQEVLQIGDTVKVISMNLKGTVHTLPNAKGDLYVQMGIIRSLVNINDLILIDEDSPMMSGAKANKTGAGKIRMSKSATISPEINLIGKTTDEAIALLDKYLDDAYLSHLGSVRIVHGKGTGALRNAVHTYLKRQKHVKSYHLGEYGEGDAGVTIAEFK